MSAHGPSRDAEAAALHPMPMTSAEIVDLVARARTWRAPVWEDSTPEQRSIVSSAILEWRRGRGISARKAAREIPVGVASWRKWERGLALPQSRHEIVLRDRGCPLPEIVRLNRRGQRDAAPKEAA